MSVMHAQTKKGRVVSKHGRINTFRRKEEVRHDKHRSKATLWQWTSIASCSLFLTDTSRTSSPPWLNSHGLGLCSVLQPLSSYPGLASLWPGELLWAFLLCIYSFQYRYIVVLTHGDLRKDLADDHVVCIRNDLFTGKKRMKRFLQVCVDNIKPDDAFTSCFLYSLETQHTIGWIVLWISF